MIKLTILNSMAGTDFESALDRHVEWGLTTLDLKDQIFGKGILDLTDEEALKAADLISERGLSVHCFSTLLFHEEIELGEVEFRKRYMTKLDRTISLARILRPQMIRLLAAQTAGRADIADSMAHIDSVHRWLIPLYGEAVDRLSEAGQRVTIENEVGKCVLSNLPEILVFFALLKRRDKVHFTWDAQNLWQMGTFPSLEVYNKLKHRIGYYHVKGGQSVEPGGPLVWRTSLEDASWPVVDITRQVVADGVSPVICLNPSHGKPKDGYDYTDVTVRDIDFIRRSVPEVE